jgi:hypothetical protein
MTRYRPPLGGLFRLSGPGAREAAAGDEVNEARDAIRHFVRVLERLDRDGGRPARPKAARRRAASRSAGS